MTSSGEMNKQKRHRKNLNHYHHTQRLVRRITMTVTTVDLRTASLYRLYSQADISSHYDENTHAPGKIERQTTEQSPSLVAGCRWFFTLAGGVKKHRKNNSCPHLTFRKRGNKVSFTL